MNRELAAEFLELAERLHDLALRIEEEANYGRDEIPGLTEAMARQIDDLFVVETA